MNSQLRIARIARMVAGPTAAGGSTQQHIREIRVIRS
jgi:hypothetical protein